MALLKNNGQGIYISQDNASKITGDTPGDLTLGTLGQNYIYIDEIVMFKHTLSFGSQGDNMPGLQINRIGSGKTGWTTGNADLGGFILNAIVDETGAEQAEEFGKRSNRDNAAAIYLVKQTASDVFRTFPNNAFAQKKYCPTIIFSVDTAEKMESKKDHVLANFLLGEVWS